MERLILRILEHDDAGLHAEWVLFRDGYKIASSEVAALLANVFPSIPKAKQERRITVLVPGQQVLLTAIDIPAKQRRHISRILPFLVEEQLAEDIALLHLARGTQSAEQASLPVAVV